MSLDTIISAGLHRTPRPSNALVLMGGGARTAYQVGVLRALANMLKHNRHVPKTFPFKVLVGTSAGAINAACLASFATQGLSAFERLAEFWGALRSSEVYRLRVAPWARFSRYFAALSLTRRVWTDGAVLDNMPLVDTLHKVISLSNLEESLRSGAIEALAVTASSYSSGIHWTFCHTGDDEPPESWARPGRRAEFQPITIEHLMASSAIPFLFPATPLWVDGRREFFGDGSMRQVSPLSPAMHLRARKILVVGVSQPERSSMAGNSDKGSARGPSLGSIAGHAMASVFHDTLQADVEQTARVTQTMQRLARDAGTALPYRAVEVLAISPSQSLDALAYTHARELPAATRDALGGLGILRGGGGALASYLLFEPGFVQALITMGENDAHARRPELMAFFDTQ